MPRILAALCRLQAGSRGGRVDCPPKPHTSSREGTRAALPLPRPGRPTCTASAGRGAGHAALPLRGARPFGGDGRGWSPPRRCDGKPPSLPPSHGPSGHAAQHAPRESQCAGVGGPRWVPPRREDRRAWGWGPGSSAGRPATSCPAIPYPGTSGVRSSPREQQAGSLKAVAVSRSQGVSPPARCGRAEGGSSLLSQRLGAAGVHGLSLCLCLLSLAPLSLRGHSSLDLGLPG